MNYIINESHLFMLLDSIFPDLSVKKIRSQNPAYAIESNDDEMFHYENGSVNVNPDLIKMINKFAPIRMTEDVVNVMGKWIHNRTGLKPRVIWIGLKEYNVEPHLNESFDKLRARRLMHIANDYFNNLSSKDVCDYWDSDGVDDYVTETMAEMVRFITDDYPNVSADDWHDTYEGIYEMLDSIGYSNDIRDFFYESLDNCNNLNESMYPDKPMKKFNRDSNPGPGKYGKMIEKLTYQYFSDIKESVCDVICMKADNLDSYILLVLLNHSRSEVGLVKYLENFIPIDIMVLFRTSFGCDKED